MPATILIVENHDAVRQALRDWLEAIFPRLHLMEAVCQEEANALVSSASPQLVIMDIDIPGGNGLQMTHQIKTASPPVKILVIGSYDDAIYRAKAMANGASAYVPKQALLTELIPALNSLLTDIQE